MAHISAEEIESIPDLSDGQRQAIRYLQEAEKITTGEYSNLAGVSSLTVLRDFKDLADGSIL